MSVPVKIYTKASCPFCINAKRLFDRLGVAYEETSVDGHPELRAQLREKYAWPTVPVILIGERMVGGFDDVSALEKSGELATLLAG